MGSRIVIVPCEPTLQGVGQALRNAIPLPEPDAEEQAERRELRKIEIGEAVRK